MSYSLSYTVAAATALAAVASAVALLRSSVRLRGVNSTTDLGNGYWRVSLNVWEDA